MSTTMTASVADFANVAQASTGKGFWTTVFNAIVEGRARDAQRLVRRYEASVGVSTLSQLRTDAGENAVAAKATF